MIPSVSLSRKRKRNATLLLNYSVDKAIGASSDLDMDVHLSRELETIKVVDLLIGLYWGIKGPKFLHGY